MIKRSRCQCGVEIWDDTDNPAHAPGTVGVCVYCAKPIVIQPDQTIKSISLDEVPADERAFIEGQMVLARMAGPEMLQREVQRRKSSKPPVSQTPVKKHRYGHAFCLLTFESSDGHEKEVLWNSRDGVVPMAVRSPNTGGQLYLTDDKHYAPDHVPAVGDRIFVDLTEIRARVFASRRVDLACEDRESRAALEHMYESREEAVDSIAREMMATPWPAPDVLVVSAGYIEELLELRRAGAVPETTVQTPPQPNATAEPASPITAPSMLGMVDVELFSRLPISIVLDPTVKPGEWHFRWPDRPDSVLTAPVRQPPSDATKSERPLAWNRKGEPIYDFVKHALLFADRNYQRIANTVINADVEVSTIWLGADHGKDAQGRPLIFETAVLLRGEVANTFRRFRRQYATEEEARDGHNQSVRLVVDAIERAEQKERKGGN